MKRQFKSFISFILVIVMMLSCVVIVHADSENLALRATVKKELQPADADVKYVNDGNRKASGTGKTWIVTEGSNILFEFDETVSFNQLDIYEFNTFEVSRLKGYIIEASLDGKAWEVLSEKGEDYAICDKTLSATHFSGSINFDKVNAKYLRLTIIRPQDPNLETDTCLAYIEEIEIYDTMPNQAARDIKAEPTAPIGQTEVIPEISSYGIIDYSQIIEDEVDWILTQQVSSPGNAIDGALLMNGNGGGGLADFNPYFANMAFEHALLVPKPEVLEAARRYILSYIAHIERTPDKYGLVGTIYDWKVNTKDYTDNWSKETYSASDSRGTTFMLMLRRYYQATGDAQLLLDNKDDIYLLFESAAKATMYEDGLTEAINADGYRHRYLQDNCQVWAGTEAMLWLQEKVFKDTKKTAEYEELFERVTAGLETMWREKEKEYLYFKTPAILERAVDWNVFFGDAVSEVFPVLYRLSAPTTEENVFLYNKLSSYHPRRVVRVRSQSLEFPWMCTALVSAMMGDKVRVNEQINNMKAKYIDNGHSWPWHVYESGATIEAAQIMRDQLNLAYNKRLVGNDSNIVLDGNLVTTQNLKSAVIDLGVSSKFNRVVVKTNNDIGNNFTVSYSDDGQKFYATANNVNLSQNGDKMFSAVNSRFVKVDFEKNVDVRVIEVYYEKENIAAGKTASASTENDSAANAVDNSTVTIWRGKTTTDHWFKIDLGSKMNFNEMEILWDYDCYDKNYSILVSDDDIVYREAKMVTAGKGGNETVKFETQNARYIKLVRDSLTPSVSAIFDVRVYNTNIVSNVTEGYANVAKMSGVVATDTMSGTGLLNDGLIGESKKDAANVLYADPTWITSTTRGITGTYDLGAIYDVDKIVLKSGSTSTSTTNYISKFKVETASDAAFTNPVTLGTYTNENGITPDIVAEVSFDRQPMRYIRFKILDDTRTEETVRGWLYVSEFEVWGYTDVIVTGDANVARKPWVIPTVTNLTPNAYPTRLNDGVFGSSTYNGPDVLYGFATSINGTNSGITGVYDLGANYEVDKIILYTGSTAPTNYITSFSIETASDAKFTNPVTLATYTDPNGIQPNVGAEVLFSKQPLRYIRFKILDATDLTKGSLYVSEFEVWGYKKPEPEIEFTDYSRSGNGVSFTINSVVDMPSAELIVAAYTDDGRLVDVIFKEISLTSSTYIDTIEFENSFDKAHVMIWNSLESLIPITRSVEIR